MSGALILCGYAVLIGHAGWWGLAAVGAHVALQLLAVRAGDAMRRRE